MFASDGGRAPLSAFSLRSEEPVPEFTQTSINEDGHPAGPAHPRVILRQRSPRQSRGLPTKDLCTSHTHKQKRQPGARTPGILASHPFAKNAKEWGTLF